MEQYLIYLRKSRSDLEAEAHGEGETLSRHEHALLELAKRQHLNVTDIYREVVSGDTIAARPMMQRVLSEVEQGVWTGVLVMEVERLARGDTIDQGIIAQTFKFSDTKIITPIKTYDPQNEFDEEYFEFGLFMSRREYKIINRRLQRGKQASAKEGKWVNHRPPYGYRRVKLPDEKGWTLEVVEEQAAVVRLIFDLYVNGLRLPDGTVQEMALGKIGKYLDDEGIPSPDGSLWIRSTVSNVLQNPAYIGYVRWGWKPQRKKSVDGTIIIQRERHKPGEYELYKGRHPAIISQELFDRAAELRIKRDKPSNRRSSALQNPLARVVFCGRCGHAMIRRVNGCRPVSGSLVCTTHGCPTVSSDAALVEERLLSGLAEWLEGYELTWKLDQQRSSASAVEVKQLSRRQCEAELEKLRKQLDRTHDLLEQGIYDTDTFLARSRSLSEKMDAQRSLIEQLSADIKEAEETKVRQTDIIPKVKNLLSVYRELPSAADKNKLLKEVVEKVVYKKERVEGQKLSADGFELEIYPRIPHK